MSSLSIESVGPNGRERALAPVSRLGAKRFRVKHLTGSISAVPVDLFGDPDGVWSYEDLVEGAGFDPSLGVLSIGALTQPYAGFPEGAAVVALTSGTVCSIALVDCVATGNAATGNAATSNAANSVTTNSGTGSAAVSGATAADRAA
jgi:hypothetical protein